MNKQHFFFFVLLFFHNTIFSLTVGSDTVPSRQSFVTFPAADTDNEILGFAAMENGFALQDSTTTCTFNAFFPASGFVNLSGGTLVLSQDLSLESPVSLGVGTIDGNSHCLSLPTNTNLFCVPAELLSTVLTLTASFAIGDNVNSVDWSFDDTYLLMGADTAGGVLELQVYWNQGDGTFTFTNSEDVNGNVQSVRWEPASLYFAYGRQGGTELQTRFYNVAAGTIDVIDSDNIGRVNAISYNPDATFLAVGRQGGPTTDYFRVYPIANGVLGTPRIHDVGITRTVQRNAVDWQSTGTFIAVGLNGIATATELQVFDVSNTTTIAPLGEEETGITMFAVNWFPTSLLLATGRANTVTRLRFYDYDPLAPDLVEVLAETEAQTVREVHWTGDGKQLVITTNNDGAGDELIFFSYNSTTTTLMQYTSADLGGTSRCVRWSHDKKFVATSDQASDELKIFAFLEGFLTLKDLKLKFNSDIIFDKAIVFDGESSIEGNNHTLDLSVTGSIVISSNSSLLLRDLTLSGVGDNSLVFLDATSTLTLQDVTIIQNGDYTLETGFFDIKGDVCVTGTHTFVYGTDVASTIYQDASLTFDTGMTFSYAPTSDDSDLVSFQDSTAKLILAGASLHSTSTGIQLTKGTLVIDGNVQVTSDATVQAEGIQLGDGVSSVNDMCVDIQAESQFDIASGVVVYNNINS